VGLLVFPNQCLGGGHIDLYFGLALPVEKPAALSSRPLKLVLLFAQGFGIGRIPFAPGTFGSVLGLGWFALLLLPGSFWGYLAGIVIGLGVSVWACDVGEKALGKKDPGSVVLDEVAAIPLCFLAWLGIEYFRNRGLCSPSYFFSAHNWLSTLGVFAAFRFFDIVKPWPARQSQSLPGGWGISIDDALAALYVNLVTMLVWGSWRLMFGHG